MDNTPSYMEYLWLYMGCLWVINQLPSGMHIQL